MPSLREYRETRRVFQHEVADYLGVSRPTYIKYEKDSTKLTIGQAKSICEFFGCSMDDIDFGL